MVLRHHNEAESLNAVQKMDWEWKLGEIPGAKVEIRKAWSSVSLRRRVWKSMPIDTASKYYDFQTFDLTYIYYTGLGTSRK